MLIYSQKTSDSLRKPMREFPALVRSMLLYCCRHKEEKAIFWCQKLTDRACTLQLHRMSGSLWNMEPYRLIRARWAKHSRHSLELNLLLPFFVSRHCTYRYHHLLTQPDRFALPNRSTGSMSLYGNAAGTAVESWLNSQRSHTTLPI